MTGASCGSVCCALCSPRLASILFSVCALTGYRRQAAASGMSVADAPLFGFFLCLSLSLSSPPTRLLLCAALRPCPLRSLALAAWISRASAPTAHCFFCLCSRSHTHHDMSCPLSLSNAALLVSTHEIGQKLRRRCMGSDARRYTKREVRPIRFRQRPSFGSSCTCF